jgi:DNA polymerase III epsilon subunit-like protein
VIEIAVVLFPTNGKVLDRFSKRINPQRPIPKSAQWVHGISDADVANAPTSAEVIPKAHAVMAKADMVFAFNSPFDMRFMINEWLLGDLGVPDAALYDVARLARRAGLGTADLGIIASNLGVTQVRAHSALGDVETTAGCLVKLLQMGFRSEETLQSVIAAHDLTVPVYGTARALPTVLHSYDKIFGIDPLRGPLNVPGKIPSSAQICDRKSRCEAAGRKLGKAKQPTDGVPVCITGALPGIPRKFITPRLDAVGYAYVKEVSYRVDFMVAGHKPTERKLDDAR